jgi:hypothetical protein
MAAFSYVASFNTGRAGLDFYTLERLAAMRASLASGIDHAAGSLRVTRDTFPMGEGVRLLADLLLANRGKGKDDKPTLPRPIDGTPWETMRDRLDAIAEDTAPAVVDGNTRALASLLNYAVTGAFFELPTIEVPTPEGWNAESLKANTLYRNAADWKARTAGVIAGIESKFFAVEADLVAKLGWKRGTAQHAWASAGAVRSHGLDLARCASLTAAGWRQVRDESDTAKAEALAYAGGEEPAPFRPATAAKRKIVAGFPKNDPRFAILDALANGDAAGFDGYFG